MPLHRSQNATRAQNWRVDELPEVPATVVTAPDRDPSTGRFVPGNRAARRRRLKQVAKGLPWLDPAQCEGWLAPYVVAAQEHAGALVGELRSQSAKVNPIAEELAAARMAYRAFMQIGLQGDRKALSEARAWLREARQHAIALEGFDRENAPAGGPNPRLAAIEAQADQGGNDG